MVSQVWSDFDGDATYGDYSLSAGSPPTATNLRSYQPGLAEVDEWVAEGSVYDSHPTLVYMQARHYDPTIGRFIQPDSLAMASMTTQGMNRYTYCENDPVNFSDPTGRSLQPRVTSVELSEITDRAMRETNLILISS